MSLICISHHLDVKFCFSAQGSLGIAPLNFHNSRENLIDGDDGLHAGDIVKTTLDPVRYRCPVIAVEAGQTANHSLAGGLRRHAEFGIDRPKKPERCFVLFEKIISLSQDARTISQQSSSTPRLSKIQADA
jgi:hypothetical protein